MEGALLLLLPSGHLSITPVFLQWGLTCAELGGVRAWGLPPGYGLNPGKGTRGGQGQAARFPVAL